LAVTGVVVSIYRTPHLDASLSHRMAHGRGLSSSIIRGMGRLDELIRRTLVTLNLTTAEWLALVDALVAAPSLPRFPLSSIAPTLADELAIGCLRGREDFDGPGLLARVQAMPPAELLSILDTVERFYARREEENEPPAATLVALGVHLPPDAESPGESS